MGEDYTGADTVGIFEQLANENLQYTAPEDKASVTSFLETMGYSASPSLTAKTEPEAALAPPDLTSPLAPPSDPMGALLGQGLRERFCA